MTLKLNTTFKKTERIRKRKDFNAVFENGKRFYSPGFVVIISPNTRHLKRMGVIVGKKNGKAHRRNRIKRLVREFFRLNKSLFPAETDTIVLVNKKNSLDSYQEVRNELLEVLNKCAKSARIS